MNKSVSNVWPDVRTDFITSVMVALSEKAPKGAKFIYKTIECINLLPIQPLKITQANAQLQVESIPNGDVLL